jgi:uncharacterized membrane protein YeaQ/YmgE (transglycosylase-associated protein family)
VVVLGLFILLLIFFVGFPLLGMALWAIFTTIVVGLILGALGRLIVPGAQRIGLLLTVLAGLCGSILGGFVGSKVFYVGHIGTLLLEIGVSALAVYLLSGRQQRLPNRSH